MNKLTKMRKLSNLTQKEISKRLYINQNSYSQYESGKRTPSIEMLPKLAEILNCSIEELVLAIIETKKQSA